jgi:hypothetical protein
MARIINARGTFNFPVRLINLVSPGVEGKGPTPS